MYDPGSNTFTNSGQDILDSIQNSQKGIISDTLCSGFTTELGIGSLLFNECPVKLIVPNALSVLFINRDALQSRGNVKSRLPVDDLKDLLQRCEIISSTDWPNVDVLPIGGTVFVTDVIIHSTALGLAVSGTYLRNEVSPDVRKLLKYINDWINDMTSPPLVHETYSYME